MFQRERCRSGVFGGEGHFSNLAVSSGSDSIGQFGTEFPPA